MNIVLIGYRGTGKSTIGRLLAQRLGRPFLDSDVLLVERAGRTIKQIFEEVSEPGFRDLESHVIADLAAKKDHVLALGGGAVLRPQNIAALKPNSICVWLQADPETLHTRIQADAATSANRPNLTAKGGADEIRVLLETREPLYRAAADLTLDVAALTPESAVDALLQALNLP